MIAFAIGVIVGIPVAVITGKLLGKASEVLVALIGIPIITYAIALYELGMFAGLNASIEGFSPEFIAGTETFLGLIVALLYTNFVTRRGVRIDDFIQISLTSFPYTILGIALAAQFWPGFLGLGMVSVAVMMIMSLRNPLRGLNARPCPQELGNCLTDDDSLMCAVVKGTLLVGGRTLREFPRAKELAECMKRAGKPSSTRKAAGLLLSMLPLLAMLAPPGDLTIAAGLGTAYLSTLLSTVLLTKGQPTPCPELAKEYREFLRKRKRKLDVVV